MPTLNEVLSLLQRVRSLQFEARSEAATGWNGVGTGAVTVSQPAAGVVAFDEAGTWQPNEHGRPAIGFRNVFRWSAISGALRLEHLRFGIEHPVLLFDMAPDESGTWREVSPHQCRDDCYTATLATEDDRLIVAWTIVGPRKREAIRYTYW